MSQKKRKAKTHGDVLVDIVRGRPRSLALSSYEDSSRPSSQEPTTHADVLVDILKGRPGNRTSQEHSIGLNSEDEQGSSSEGIILILSVLILIKLNMLVR